MIIRVNNKENNNNDKENISANLNKKENKSRNLLIVFHIRKIKALIFLQESHRVGCVFNVFTGNLLNKIWVTMGIPIPEYVASM